MGGLSLRGWERNQASTAIRDGLPWNGKPSMHPRDQNHHEEHRQKSQMVTHKHLPPGNREGEIRGGQQWLDV